MQSHYAVMKVAFSQWNASHCSRSRWSAVKHNGISGGPCVIPDVDSYTMAELCSQQSDHKVITSTLRSR